MGQRCTILELSESKCRWPIGDPSSPDFFFCGGKTIEGLPYCGHHSRIAYQPTADRRRDRRPCTRVGFAALRRVRHATPSGREVIGRFCGRTNVRAKGALAGGIGDDANCGYAVFTKRSLSA